MAITASVSAPKARPEDGSQRNAPTLAELQDMFQRAVMTGDETILSLIPANSHTSADVLFGVYQYAYLARLRDCLASDHETLVAVMGREAFDDMANAYLAAHPSRYCNVRWLANDLPRFLQTAEPYCRQPHVGELAALEQALANAFDAQDREPVTLAGLQTVAAEHWPALTFAPHPSTCRLNLRSNAFDIWLAVREETSVPDPEHNPEPQAFLVWRQEQTSRVRSLGAEEAMMWDEAAKGTPFGRLCELLAVYDDPETAPLRAAQFLQTWLGSEFLVAPEDLPS
jgi:Putative DNA-binding domain